MSNSLMKIVIKLIMVLMITTVSNCDSVTFPEDVERFDDVDIYNDDDEFDPENVFADDEELRDVGLIVMIRNLILKRFWRWRRI